MHAAMNVTVKISSGVSGTSLDTYEVQNPRDSSCLSAAAPCCAALLVFADVLPGSMAYFSMILLLGCWPRLVLRLIRLDEAAACHAVLRSVRFATV